MGGGAETATPLHEAVGAVEVRRDVVAASGADTMTFLQGQLSQDIVAMTVGETRWSLLLAPQGRVDALVRVTRTSEDHMMLDVDGGFGEAVLARLARFKLRVACELELLAWGTVAVRGPGADDLGASLPVDADHLVAPAGWPGMEGFDLLGPEVDVPAGVPACDLDAYEAARIVAGWPAMGTELDERTIPAEAGIVEQTVSFTKGCFTGQELVARIDSRGGNVPRRLRGLVLAAGAVPEAGAEVQAGGAVVGRCTSVATSGPHGGPVALAYLARKVDVPAEVTVAGPDGELAARARALPLQG